MNIQKTQNVTFGARINVSYSTKAGEMRPAAEKLATYLRKIGGDEIRNEITVRNRFINVSTWFDFKDGMSNMIETFSVKGKKAKNFEMLKRIVSNKKSEILANEKYFSSLH